VKRWKKIVLAIFIIPTIWGTPWSIDHFYARVFLEYAPDHPQLLSSPRILESMGLDFHNDDLEDLSVEGTRRDMARAEDNLEMLRRYDRLGYLVAQIMRAVRLVVDTGIRQKRWTRQQAIDYMLANSGMPEGEIVSEVERYIVIPGQACAYMVGYLEIMRLRDEARQAMGGDFDLREFHQAVLENGALPLTLLRSRDEAWYGVKEDAEGA
jgi:uncharacterized protein (DUF885 family)